MPSDAPAPRRLRLRSPRYSPLLLPQRRSYVTETAHRLRLRYQAVLLIIPIAGAPGNPLQRLPRSTAEIIVVRLLTLTDARSSARSALPSWPPLAQVLRSRQFFATAEP